MNEPVQPDKETDARLKALFDPIRIRIAACLKVPRTPKQVADLIDIKPNNLYHHFRVLKKAGVIDFVETRQGKGFIKEDYYRLRAPGCISELTDIPGKHRQLFLFSLLQALREDFKITISRYDKAVVLGTRNDFRFKQEDLETVRATILKHRDLLRAELDEICADGKCTNYQASVFGFRL
jgi:DNA-binding transcriptional ArsR family regulator